MKMPNYWPLLNAALKACIITIWEPGRAAFLARVRRCLKRNFEEPGDCKGDEKLLIALAIAEAHVGRGAGWIPEVQRIGCQIANLPE